MESVLERHIEIGAETRGGKPRISGTRITVADIVMMNLRLGLSVHEIASKFDLDLAAVHAALAYYYDHRSEIDESVEADEAFAEAFRRNNPAPLQEKLKSLTGS